VIAAPSRKLFFDVTLDEVNGGGRCLQVGFYGKLPRPDVVDKIVRESLEHAILIDPTVDILATGFLGDAVLESDQYSGSLVYKASQKKIMTYDESRGVKVTTSSTSTYFVEVQEDKTASGITPERKWLSVTIVFPKQPTLDVAYEAIFVETQKLASKGLDIGTHVNFGDKNVKPSWKYMMEADGSSVFAEYDAATKTLKRQGKVLKHLP